MSRVAVKNLALALTVFVGVTACTTPDSGKGNWATVAAEPGKDAESSIAFGSYLAGISARAQGDTRAAAGFMLDAIAADPNNIVLLQQGFSLAISDSRYDDARRLGERILVTEPDNSLVRFYLVLGELKDGNYKRVLRDLDQVPEAGLNKLVKPIVAAWAEAGRKDKADALLALKSLEETQVFLPFALSHRAYILDYLNDRDAEIAYKTGMVAERYGDVRFILGYAALLARGGKAYEAKDVIRRGKEVFGDSLSAALVNRRLQNPDEMKRRLITTPAEGVADAFYGAALALSQDGANGPASFYLRLALYLRPDFDQATFMLARILEDEQETVAALRLYQSIDPSSDLKTEAQLREVWLMAGQGKEDEALAKLIALDSATPGRADIVAALGDLHRQRKDYPNAIAGYTRAIELTKASGEPESRHWPLYYARAMTYDTAKDWTRAEADLRKALELQADQPDVLNYLGYSLLERGERTAEAIAMIDKAVKARPNDGYIVDSLGWARYVMGQYSDAVEILERAVLLRPEDPTINEHLGDAYWQVGRKVEARFQWSHALTLDAPEDRIAVIREKIAKGIVPGSSGQNVQKRTKE